MMISLELRGGLRTINKTSVSAHLVVLVLFFVLCFFAFGLAVSISSIVSLLIFTYSFIVLYGIDPRRIQSTVFVYFMVFSVFHLGAVIPLMFDFGLPPDVDIALSRWFYGDTTGEAIDLVSIALLGYVLGALISKGFVKSRYAYVDTNTNTNTNFEKILRRVSSLFFGVGLLLWFWAIVSHFGFGFFGVSYLEYQILVDNNMLLVYSYLLISTGLVLLCSCSMTRVVKYSLAIFFIWGVVAFLIGLRGEVLFPLSVVFVVIARNGYVFDSKKVAIGVFVVLVLISGVREIRGEGLNKSEISQLFSGPVGALAELGSSLRPVVEVISWRKGGDDYIYGASYWAPFERALMRVSVFFPPIDAEQDDRLLNVLVGERAGPIGFSPVAEAYRNFGAIGVFVFFLVLAILFSFFDYRHPGVMGNSVLVSILLPFIIQVRNAFTPVPLQISLGLLLVFLVYLFSAKGNLKQTT